MKILLVTILLLIATSLQQNCLLKRDQYTDATRDQIRGAENGMLDLNYNKYYWQPQLPVPQKNQFVRLWVKLSIDTLNVSRILWANGMSQAIGIYYNRNNHKLRFIMSTTWGRQYYEIEVQTAGEIFHEFVLISVKFTESDFMVYYQGEFQGQSKYSYNPPLHQFQKDVRYDFNYARYGSIENMSGYIKDIQIVQDMEGDELEGCFTSGNLVEICEEDDEGNCIPEIPELPEVVNIKRDQYTDATRYQIRGAQNGILDLNHKEYYWNPQLPIPQKNQIVRLWVKLSQYTYQISNILWANGMSQAISISYNRNNHKLRFFMSRTWGSSYNNIKVQTDGQIFEDFVLISVKFTKTHFMVYYQGEFQDQSEYSYNPPLHQFQKDVRYDFNYARFGSIENMIGYIKDIQIVQDIEENGDQEIYFTSGKPVQICDEDDY